MKKLLVSLLIGISPSALALDSEPSVTCTLSYYERAAHWQDDVSLRGAELALSPVSVTDELKGFKSRARLVSVCENGIETPCRIAFEAHTALAKGDFEVEGTQALVRGTNQKWSLVLKAGRFEEAALECSVRWL